MSPQQAGFAVPPHITACLNRATDRAAKVLRYDHGFAARRRLLRPIGEAVILDGAAEAGRHPSDTSPLSFLETVLCDVMVEKALSGDAP